MTVHPAPAIDVRRLGPADEARAHALFATMAAVFEEEHEALDAAYVQRLLARDDFWAMAALEDGVPVGGITAYALPMTRTASTELFIYDVAVRADRQRRGIGRALLTALLEAAAASGIEVGFVPVENEDTHALDFYRALGGTAAPVTFFTFSR